MTKLLFIEGVSGVGKSTMTKALAHSLMEQDHTVRAYVEFDHTNPIDFYSTAYLPMDTYEAYAQIYPDLRQHAIYAGKAMLVRYYAGDTPIFSGELQDLLTQHEFCWHPKHLISRAEYTATYRVVWESFAADLHRGNTDYVLFDGSLLFHPINDMLRNYSCTADMAYAHVSEMLAALGELPWQIAYLEPVDIGTQLRQAHRDRGECEPTDEDIQFWQTRSLLDHAVLSRLPTELWTRYPVTELGWDHVQTRIEHTL